MTSGDDNFVAPLTPRELQVLKLLVAGNENRQIAEQLGLATDTVKTHMKHILWKLNASGRTEAAVKALKAGLVADQAG